MGDRSSICFKRGNEESVCVFAHWGGTEFFANAEEYVKELVETAKNRRYKNSIGPFERLDPEYVVAGFITRYKPGDLYIGRTEKDGDDSDNGHRCIALVPDDDTARRMTEFSALFKKG